MRSMPDGSSISTASSESSGIHELDFGGCLLEVALYCAGVADLRFGGVRASIPPSAALPQQVPALIQCGFYTLQLFVLWVVGAASDGLGLEPMFLGNQLVDLRQNRLVVHELSVPPSGALGPECGEQCLVIAASLMQAIADK